MDNTSPPGADTALDQEEQLLARLLREAGGRAMPPADVTQRVHARTRQAWQLQQQGRGRRNRWLALAASVVLALTLTWWLLPSATDSGVGQIVSVEHGALLQGDSNSVTMVARQEVRTGDTLVSGEQGYVEIQTAGGTRVLLASDTRLHWTRPGRLTLLRGELYIDTHGSNGKSAPLAIETAFGTVHHLGTQYRVSVAGDRLRVAVRSGEVVVETLSGRGRASRAEMLTVDAYGTIASSPAAPSGEGWNWIDKRTAAISINGRSVHAVLSDIAQQNGLQLSFADAAAEGVARRFKLHGPVLTLPAAEALDVILATTTLHAQIDSERLYVSGS